MLKRLRNRRGQSILEYLLITGVIIAAIVAISAKVKTSMTNVFENAATQTGTAATVLNKANFSNLN